MWPAQRFTKDSELAKTDDVAHSDLDRLLIPHPQNCQADRLGAKFMLDSGTWLFLRAGPSTDVGLSCRWILFLSFEKSKVNG